ncbi:Malignant T-cell-amplified sequence 1 [Xyrichtys novacula]|uniref:Malignant T-cell-amplified sequence n=1 Tax=Xyrichtys novacula TaxID=13765 RepID=A0AAV1FDV7_XYRNO|nr:Malignant T-cell-amplified sequence 1 [Xyrichtys novacula]
MLHVNQNTMGVFLFVCFRFDEKENVSNCIQLKTSVIKGIKNQLLEQFPDIESWLNQIMPKKDPVKIVRCHEHIEILTVNGELLFFRQREGPFYPTLRLLHKYPFILPHQQVDKGAIKFVLSGANIMCPGLTSPGAKLYPAGADTVVVSFHRLV